MKKVIQLLFLVATLGPASKAATVIEKIYLNAGPFITVDNNTLPSLAFNSTALFVPRNKVISLAAGDALQITVINNDSVTHGFAVKNIFAGTLISAGDSFTTVLNFPAEGIFIYYDQLDFPKNSYLGAAGMICVEAFNNAQEKFYWNFKEQQSEWNSLLVSGQTVSWNDYKPDYFTINGLSKPDLQSDSTAALTGNVGDSIRIFMANTGLSCHPIHFHGYHCRIIYSSKDSRQVGWEKDTFPLWPHETMLIVLVPDKPGLFPVHDHNLFSQTGGYVYNNGMFIMMTIN